MKPKHLIVLALGAMPASAQTFGEHARAVQASIQAVRAGSNAEPPAFVFGSFPIEEEAPQEEVKTDLSPAVVVEAIQPPSFQCKGVLMLRGRQQVITEKGGYFVGDKVDGYELVAITKTEVTCRKGGKTFTIPAR